MPTHADLIRRARITWLTTHPHAAEPTWSSSSVEVYEGRTYVVLRRGSQVIDIYRYKPATAGWRDTLKLMKPTGDGRYWPGPYGRRRVAA